MISECGIMLYLICFEIIYYRCNNGLLLTSSVHIYRHLTVPLNIPMCLCGCAVVVKQVWVLQNEQHPEISSWNSCSTAVFHIQINGLSMKARMLSHRYSGLWNQECCVIDIRAFLHCETMMAKASTTCRCRRWGAGGRLVWQCRSAKLP